MKHVLFITLEYPPQKGGVASYYEGLVGALSRQGYAVEIISGGRRWFTAYFGLRKAIKKLKPDIIFVGQILPLGTAAYFQGLLPNKLLRTCFQNLSEAKLKKRRTNSIILSIFQRAAAEFWKQGTKWIFGNSPNRRKRAPYVVFTHGMDILTAQKSWRKRWLVKKILKQAKLIVANSKFTRDIVEKIIYGKKLTIVRNLPHVEVVYPCPAVDMVSVGEDKEEVEALRRRLCLAGKKVLLTLGRVVERKGHDLVIKALPEILKHIPNAVYVVAGDGPYLEKLQEFVSHPPLRGGTPPLSGGYQSSVRFVGEISENDKPLYYALCDLFVMPSRQIGPDVEGFGLSFLEAAAFGKPSIGGRSGGVPEAILNGKTGVLVDPGDSLALARVVVQLLHDDTLRNELGQNAKARVLHEFTWEKQAGVLINTIDQNG